MPNSLSNIDETLLLCSPNKQWKNIFHTGIQPKLLTFPWYYPANGDLCWSLKKFRFYITHVVTSSVTSDESGPRILEGILIRLRQLLSKCLKFWWGWDTSKLGDSNDNLHAKKELINSYISLIYLCRTSVSNYEGMHLLPNAFLSNESMTFGKV